MFIYSITYSIKEALREEWLIWIQAHFISRVMQSRHFTDYSVKELLEPAPDSDMVTFNIQFSIGSLDKLELFRKNAGREIQQIHQDRYKDRFIVVETILRELRVY